MPRSPVLLAALVLALLGAPASARAAAPANTEPPGITGVAREGQTLSRGTGTWTGTDPISYSQRWQRCAADGLECVNLPATGTTYAPVAADVGATVRVVVTAANAEGVASAASAVTAVVTGTPPANTAAPVVSGNAREGQVLTAGRGTWSGTLPQAYAFEWRRCGSSGATCAAVPGRTGETYALTAADVGATLRVRVVATNAAGSGEATSAATAVVGPPAPPVATAAPAVTGTTRDGSTLSSTTGTWTGAGTITFTRRWQRCDALGLACLDTTATAPTYRLAPTDVGATLRVVVMATNPDGTATATSAATGVVAPLAPRSATPPAVAGVARELQALTASPGTWTGTTPLGLAYEWQRCDSAGQACATIPGATAATRVPTAADLGATLRIQVTASNDAGAATATSGPTAVVGPAPPVNTAAPAVTGAARDGGRLTATTGTWTGTAPLTWAYQWRRCSSTGAACKDVTGATAATYDLTPADVGATVAVRVTAANAGGTASATAPITAVVAPAAPAATAFPSVTGTPVDGGTLTATPGAWTGTPPLALSYRWERCDPLLECRPIPGATAQRYTLTSADVGLDVRVAVTAANAGGIATAASPGTGAVAPLAPSATGAPVVTGTPRDGLTLTVAAPTWAGTTPMATAVQWRRCDADGAACADVPGATGTTFVLTPADAGHTIRAAVTATNAGGSTTAESLQTPVVGAAPPANVVSPVVTGVARDGRTLVAERGEWAGTPPLEVRHRWRRCDAAGAACKDIEGAADASYVLTTADVGATIRVVVTVTNGGGTASVTTGATGVVQSSPPVNRRGPVISGRVVDGGLVTVSDGEWTGVVPFTYDHRWWHCDGAGEHCSVIPGAVDATYRVGGADVGLTLKAEVIARNAGGTTSAFTDATPVGEPAPPVSTEPPVVRGRHGAGQTLEATRGTWVGSPTLVYAYQWQRCDAGGQACTDVEGADADALTLAPVDVGARFRVRVTASNPAGSAVAVSAPGPPVRDDPPVNTGLPAVTGERVADGVPLTSDPGTWTGGRPMDAAYQWRRCDGAGLACADIPGATAPGYTPVTADVGSTLRVVVTMDNGVGAGAATSPPSAVVGPAPPRAGAPPAGAAAGRRPGPVLTGRPGEWRGAAPLQFGQRWLRCGPGGEDCTPIADATAASYELTGTDVGHLLRLEVTATNVAGGASARSAAVGPVLPLPPATAGRPTIAPEGKAPRPGAVLRADAGSWTGTEPLRYAYRWQSCVSATDCRDIAGATAAEHLVATEDVGRRLRVVVTVRNAGGETSAESAATDLVGGLGPAADARPKVVGTPVDGQTLAADPGTWSGTGPLAHAYAWQRCAGAKCTPIDGATAARYTAEAADVGARLAVKVTTTSPYGKAEAVSVPSAVVAAARPRVTARPRISRLPTVLEPGTRLKGTPGAWAGTDPLELAYQWLRCNPSGRRCRVVAGATEAAYTLVEADLRGTRLRRSLRLAVTATNAAGDATALSSPVGVRRPPPRPRLGFAAAAFSRRTLALALTCAPGGAPCAGTVAAAGARDVVDVPAGSRALVLLPLEDPPGRTVRARFVPSGTASGAAVVTRLPVVRPRGAGGTRRRP